MIFISGISIAIFISALLLVKKEKSIPDLFLFLWMLLNALHLSLFYLFYTEEIYNYPHLLGIQLPFPLLQGVLLYFYVSSVTNQFPKKKWIPYLHLIPTVLAYIYMISFFSLPVEEKIAVFKSGGKGYEIFREILMNGTFLSGIVYVIWSSVLLKRHKENIHSQFSDIEEISLRWLQFLVYGLGVVWSVIIITQDDTLIYMGISLFVILIGFFGVQQKNIFATRTTRFKEFQKIENPVKTETTKPKYLNSGLSEELAEKHYKRLNELMVEKEFYKKTELSLTDLANELEIHSNYLSQIINEKEGKKFYDYVNTFRVDEFKRLISIPKNRQFTIMALAYDCGFNSKSSFNRYFKKNTGQTPTQYAKSNFK